MVQSLHRRSSLTLLCRFFSFWFAFPLSFLLIIFFDVEERLQLFYQLFVLHYSPSFTVHFKWISECICIHRLFDGRVKMIEDYIIYCFRWVYDVAFLMRKPTRNQFFWFKTSVNVFALRTPENHRFRCPNAQFIANYLSENNINVLSPAFFLYAMRGGPMYTNHKCLLGCGNT